MYIEIAGDGNTVEYPREQQNWMAWIMLIATVMGVVIQIF